MITWDTFESNKGKVNALRNFARRCAFRTAKQSYSGANFMNSKPGLYQWLNYGKVSSGKWTDLVHWAEDTVGCLDDWKEGHAEAACCYAILAMVRSPEDVWRAAMMAARHAKMLLGKFEEKTQEKSLTQYLGKEL